MLSVFLMLIWFHLANICNIYTQYRRISNQLNALDNMLWIHCIKVINAIIEKWDGQKGCHRPCGITYIALWGHPAAAYEGLLHADFFHGLTTWGCPGIVHYLFLVFANSCLFIVTLDFSIDLCQLLMSTFILCMRDFPSLDFARDLICL